MKPVQFPCLTSFRSLVTGVAASALCVVFASSALAQRPETKTELTEAKPEAKKGEERVLEIGKWYPGMEGGLNLTQSSYSDNWSGGDNGSITWAAHANSLAEQQTSAKFNWWNSLKLAYGQTHRQTRATDGGLSWDSPDKSTDLIDLESIGRFTLGSVVDPYVGLRAESQFQDQSDPLGRGLIINPIKVRESAGIARQWINTEEKWWVSRLGLASRQNFRKQFTSSTDAADESTEMQTTNDGGLEFVNDWRTKILENRVSWTSRLGLYQPFFYSEKSKFEDLTPAQLSSAGVDADIADFTMAADAELENIFSTQITKIISVSLYVRWVYDKYENSVKPDIADDGSLLNGDAVNAGIRKAGQFKQTLGIGLTYRFL